MSTLDAEYDGIAYVGRSTLRHPDEEESQQESRAESFEQYERLFPERRPHVFIDFSEDPVSFRDALMNGSDKIKGSSGIIVDFRKKALGQSGGDAPTINQLNKWRERFTPDMLDFGEVDNLSNEHLGNVEDMIHEGQPFVIINVATMDLDVPLTTEDKLNKIRNIEENYGVDLLGDDPSEAEIDQFFEMAKEIVNE